MTTYTLETRQEGCSAGSFGVPQWMCLAATPTFAFMALVTSAHGGGAHDVLCAASQGASLLNGMTFMYLLMSAFHSAPWLRLILRRAAGT
jgi:hypothetical protein